MEKRDIRQWVEDNAKGSMPSTYLSADELDHITICMHHIYRWYHEDYPTGHFLTAVVRNDFMEACLQADNTNAKVLYLYALFMANKIGLDYKKKALAEG